MNGTGGCNSGSSYSRTSIAAHDWITAVDRPDGPYRAMDETLENEATTQSSGPPPIPPRRHFPNGPKVGRAHNLNLSHLHGADRIRHHSRWPLTSGQRAHGFIHRAHLDPICLASSGKAFGVSASGSILFGPMVAARTMKRRLSRVQTCQAY